MESTTEPGGEIGTSEGSPVVTNEQLKVLSSPSGAATGEAENPENALEMVFLPESQTDLPLHEMSTSKKYDGNVFVRLCFAFSRSHRFNESREGTCKQTVLRWICKGTGH